MSPYVDGLVQGFKTMWNDPDLARLDKDMIPLPFKKDIFASERSAMAYYYSYLHIYQYQMILKRFLNRLLGLLLVRITEID